jgi:hypothetical protein
MQMADKSTQIINCKMASIRSPYVTPQEIVSSAVGCIYTTTTECVNKSTRLRQVVILYVLTTLCVDRLTSGAAVFQREYI